MSRPGVMCCLVGIFSNDGLSVRLFSALLLEQQEDCQLDGCRMFSELLKAKLNNTRDQQQDRPTAALTEAA